MNSPLLHISIHVPWHDLAKPDITLPTYPVKRTITYQAPFTLCNREADYATVWARLDGLKGEKM